MPSTPSSTKDETELVYLAQYEYLDEPGAVWPAQAFQSREKAEQYAVMCSGGNRCYTVIPLQLVKGRESTRKAVQSAGQLRLF